mmetsp:Transcript_31510/g.41872  ORF Transcript_31510/g.41872 Transcript_31510/m.41872 type:complete len:430 (+) Transcript_31510:149-1438(+)
MIVLLVIMTIFAQVWLSLTYRLHPTNKSYHSFSREGYLRAYTMMLGEFSDDEHKANPVIIPLFIVYTFVVTIVLLNILIAIVSDSYQCSFISSELMHGKARILFFSELHSIKISVMAYSNLKDRGKVGNFCCNLFSPQLVLSAVYIYTIVGTTTTKFQQLNTDVIEASTTLSPSCQQDTFSVEIFYVEATLLFLAFFFFLYLANCFMMSLLNDRDIADSLVHLGGKSGSSIKGTLYSFALKMVSYISFTFDSLNDDAEKKALEREEVDEKRPSTSLQTYRKVFRSLQKTKEDLKQELNTTVEQLQTSLEGTENRIQQNMSLFALEVSSIVAESEDRVLNEIQNVLKQQVVNEQSQTNGGNGHINFVADITTTGSVNSSIASLPESRRTSLEIFSPDDDVHSLEEKAISFDPELLAGPLDENIGFNPSTT